MMMMMTYAPEMLSAPRATAKKSRLERLERRNCQAVQSVAHVQLVACFHRICRPFVCQPSGFLSRWAWSTAISSISPANQRPVGSHLSTQSLNG
jgi:hypothetical protein